MTPIPRARRLSCAAVAIVCAAWLYRGPLADAVVNRGDDAFHSGDVAGAMRFYARAVGLDSRSRVACDRLAFFLALRHDAASARHAIDVSTMALDDGGDPALLADRGFAEMQLRRWSDAARDFGRAGALAVDPRYDHLASRMALRAGRRAAARAFAVRALVADPHFAPARALLRSLE